jgi:hypothetical protein
VLSSELFSQKQKKKDIKRKRKKGGPLLNCEKRFTGSYRCQTTIRWISPRDTTRKFPFDLILAFLYRRDSNSFAMGASTHGNHPIKRKKKIIINSTTFKRCCRRFKWQVPYRELLILLNLSMGNNIVYKYILVLYFYK